MVCSKTRAACTDRQLACLLPTGCGPLRDDSQNTPLPADRAFTSAAAAATRPPAATSAHSPPAPRPPQALPVRPVVAAAAKQLSVVVASQNAVKIKAAAAALRQALPGVPHTITGARRRGGARW